MTRVEILERQLEVVRVQIEKIESESQEFEIESNGARRKARKADLSLLYRREEELDMRIERLLGGGSSSVSRVIDG